MATYGDGRTRDVTREAFVTSGNTDVATADARGLMTAIRRGEAPDSGPLPGMLRGHHADRDGRSHGLCVGRSADLQPHRRTGGGQVETLEAPALATLQRCGVYSPRVLRSDRSATHRRGDADVPRRSARDACKAGSPGGHVDRQSGLRRLLDQQVGRSAGRQSQVPGRRRCRGVSRVDPSAGGTESPVRRISSGVS